MWAQHSTRVGNRMESREADGLSVMGWVSWMRLKRLSGFISQVVAEIWTSYWPLPEKLVRVLRSFLLRCARREGKNVGVDSKVNFTALLLKIVHDVKSTVPAQTKRPPPCATQNAIEEILRVSNSVDSLWDHCRELTFFVTQHKEMPKKSNTRRFLYLSSVSYYYM